MSKYDELQVNDVREISVHVTQRCNLSCKGCYANPSPDALAQSLTVGDLRWIEKTFHPKKTVLLGGEPLMYENLEKALDIFENTTLSTNGFFIKKHIDLLKEHDVKLQISIEGSKEYNDQIRGNGTFDVAIDAGKFAKENGVKTYFRVGYCAQNLKDIEWLLENVSSKYNIPLTLLPRIEKPPLGPREQIWLFDLITSSDNGSLIAMPNYMQFLGKHGRCNACSQRLNFTYDKRITPCHLMWNDTLGYIGDTLSVINSMRQSFIDIHRKIPEGCRFCPNAEVCKGGCMVSPQHLGCPLKRNFNINMWAEMHDELDVQTIVDRIETMTNLVKEAEIC